MWLAAVLACGSGAALSHRSAAVLFGLLDRWDGPVEVTVGGSGTRLRDGVRVHRAILDRRDVRTRDGIRVTSPSRTIADLASVSTERELRRVLRRAQGLQLVHPRDVLRVADRLGPRRGAATLRRVLAAAPAPTRSELEDVLLDLVLAGGFAPPDVNVPLRIGGRTVVPDLRWPAQRLVVEADSRTWHDGMLARDDDADRQALLEAHGERVVRVTWRQATRDRTRTLARLRAAGAPLAYAVLTPATP